MIVDKPTCLGSELSQADQRYVLSAFVHRYTRDHKPHWAHEPMKDGSEYPVQFASDADWLAHTLFQVTQSGKVSRTACQCQSSPTWPDGKIAPRKPHALFPDKA